MSSIALHARVREAQNEGRLRSYRNKKWPYVVSATEEWAGQSNPPKRTIWYSLFSLKCPLWTINAPIDSTTKNVLKNQPILLILSIYNYLTNFMETPSIEEKVSLNISPRNLPFVISALESEVEHLTKIKKACIKKKQFQAANDLLPNITLLESMVKYLKPFKPTPLPFK